MLAWKLQAYLKKKKKGTVWGFFAVTLAEPWAELNALYCWQEGYEEERKGETGKRLERVQLAGMLVSEWETHFDLL